MGAGGTGAAGAGQTDGDGEQARERAAAMGHASFADGAYSDAGRCFTVAMLSDPGNAKLHLNRAACYFGASPRVWLVLRRGAPCRAAISQPT